MTIVAGQSQLLRILAAAILAGAMPALGGEIRIEHQGLTVNGNLELAAGQDLSDGVILMLHGTLGHKDMEIMATLQERFLEIGRNSLAINLSLDVDDRHGFYPCERPHTHQNEDALDELDTWLAWLVEQGSRDIVLLGHSRGGNQIARYVVAREPAVTAMILLAPATASRDISADVMADLEQARASEWLDEISFLHCARTQVRGTTFVSYAAPQAAADTPRLLEDIALPVVVISGSEDSVVPDLPEKMAGLSNHNVRHIAVDGADHFFRDLYAYDVVELSLEFLESLDTATIEPEALIRSAESLREAAAQSSSKRVPIIIFVSQHGCEYCAALRKHVLIPMINAGELEGLAVIREVSLDQGFELKDFQGELSAGRDFAARYGAHVTPTLLFVDGSGREVVSRIVGISNLEYYGFYLKQRIDKARSNLPAAVSRPGGGD
jgi:pimeloyl-ACP methyl ester carboxylesterase